MAKKKTQSTWLDPSSAPTGVTTSSTWLSRLRGVIGNRTVSTWLGDREPLDTVENYIAVNDTGDILGANATTALVWR